MIITELTKEINDWFDSVGDIQVESIIQSSGHQKNETYLFITIHYKINNKE